MLLTVAAHSLSGIDADAVGIAVNRTEYTTSSMRRKVQARSTASNLRVETIYVVWSKARPSYEIVVVSYAAATSANGSSRRSGC